MTPSLPSNNPSGNQQIIDSIDSFISGLDTSTGTKTLSAAPRASIVVETPKTDEEMERFVLEHSAKLVEASVNTIIELQRLTVATGDGEMMAGLASLVSASTAAIESVSKLHTNNKKIEAAKELKKLEIEGRKEIQKLKNDGNLNLPASQTNILIATREEIIEKLTGKAKAKAVNSSDSLDFVAQPTMSLEASAGPVPARQLELVPQALPE